MWKFELAHRRLHLLHSPLLLTLKSTAHLTPSGETGVSAHFRFVFSKLKQICLFREGPQQYFSKCWMEATSDAAVRCNVCVFLWVKSVSHCRNVTEAAKRREICVSCVCM